MLLSIIIPIGPADNSWLQLLNDIQQHQQLFNAPNTQANYEIILANNSGNQRAPNTSTFNDLPITVLKTRKGRAQSMNDAAATASGEYLWFIHADTRINEHAFNTLLTTLQQRPATLLYFDLVFDELPQMSLNAIGVKWRSRILKCPFGDQAFCLSTQCFNAAGRYREDLTSGEDHYLVWQARSKGTQLQALNTSISTSARKYQRNGWLYTTTSHVFAFAKQALMAFYQYNIKK